MVAESGSGEGGGDLFADAVVVRVCGADYGLDVGR